MNDGYKIALGLWHGKLNCIFEKKSKNHILKALIQIKIHFLTKKIQPHRMIKIDWIGNNHE